MRQASADLAARGISVPPVPVGVMIEIPAAAYTADLLAREVDFFTIGTNDLIQVPAWRSIAPTSACRSLYEPLHPAILRVILMVRRAAARRRIPVSLCGEMASDPALLTLLVGLGLTEFSMTPGAIPVAKQVLSEVRHDELRAMARRILRLATVEDDRAGAAGRPRAGWRSSRSEIVSDDMTRVEKPWGYELHWAKTDRYVGKLIHVNAGHALSLQYHNLKDETIYLHSGQAAVRDSGGRRAGEAGDAARRARPHHAEDHSPDDGHRRQRHLRGVDAGAARRRPAGRSVRKDR